MLERMDPKALKHWLILAALLYLLLPWDFLPDFLGLPGRVDDLLMMAWLAWLYHRNTQSFPGADSSQQSTGDSAGAGQRAGGGTAGGQGGTASGAGARVLDAYAVLGVPHSASSEAIRAAYRARMMEYHPDKVAHLGEDLQKLAHEKSQQIQSAYQQLRR